MLASPGILSGVGAKRRALASPLSWPSQPARFSLRTIRDPAYHTRIAVSADPAFPAGLHRTGFPKVIGILQRRWPKYTAMVALNHAAAAGGLILFDLRVGMEIACPKFVRLCAGGCLATRSNSAACTGLLGMFASGCPGLGKRV